MNDEKHDRILRVLIEGNRILNQLDQVVEALFRATSNRGEYFKSELQSILKVDDELVLKAIHHLCTLSDLFQYEVESDRLIVLESYRPLDERIITTKLPIELADKIAIQRLFVTDSTNTDLEQISLSSRDGKAQISAAVAITEMQRGGRGRRAKRWVSPLAKNLYFSFKYHFSPTAFSYLSTLSLRAGITLLEVLNSFEIEHAKIKWPNDIWVNGQKLAGILVESTITPQGMDVIIGIGVNNQRSQFDEVVGNYPTSCEAILGRALDRNELVARLVERLYIMCEKMAVAPDELPDLSTQWKLYSCFYEKTVRLISDKGEEIGKEVGIDESGALLIECADGSIKSYLSGDLSLRAY